MMLVEDSMLPISHSKTCLLSEVKYQNASQFLRYELIKNTNNVMEKKKKLTIIMKLTLIVLRVVEPHSYLCPSIPLVLKIKKLKDQWTVMKNSLHY